MSKIYEALRQAELDSKKAPSTQSNGASPSPIQAPVQPSRQPSVRTSLQPSLWSSVEHPAQTTAQPSAQAVLDVPPAIDPPIAATLPRPRPISRAASTVPPETRFRPAAVEHMPVSAANIDEIAAVPNDTPTFDLTGIRAYAWSPSLNQLPALEERGAGVEQFRSLRSRMYEFRDLNALKSILVSSGLPQEGKSFVAANLAISFARHKAARVLLIDGDMRRATLHKVFGCSEGPGLTEYLAGKSTLSEIMQRPKPSQPGHPLPSGLASLTFIPGGNEHDKAADLSGNHRFDHLIETVAPFFDWIVVDSSPVNLVSDGVNLARACDAALLVARGAVTKYEDAQRAMVELKATKILGFVLNAVENPTVAHGYYGYDGYEKDAE